MKNNFIIEATVVIIFSAVFTLCGCSTKWGEFENRILRMETQAGHASIQRGEMTGNNLAISGKYGLPEWFIGKAAFTEFFLPKMLCTTLYDETGEVRVSMTCEQMPDISVEAKADAKGGFVGDVIGVGEAATLGSSYEADAEAANMWIESIKQAVLRSTAEEATKQKQLETLDSLGKSLSGILGGGND